MIEDLHFHLPAGCADIDDSLTTGAVSELSWGVSELPDIVCEPVGRAYWSFVGRGRGIDGKKLANVSALSAITSKEGGGKDSAVDSSFELREDITADNVGDYTYYELLGFDKYGTRMTDDSLKKAYRKAVLMYHPDKVGTPADEGEDDEVFIAMQKAYDTLTDFTKKRKYDSSLDFDDSIPSEEAGKGEDFFEVYGPVFTRNERFAVKIPAPSLGDLDTPMDEVNKFYEYWLNFESWRDFSMDAAVEHDLEDAEDRHHKRWMEKENAKKIKDMKKAEYKRLSKLVDLARAADIRIKRARQAEVDAKKAKKEAKLQEKRDAEEAIAKKAADEAAAALEAENRQKSAAKDAKAQRETLKKEGRRLKKLLRGAFPAALQQQTSSDSTDTAEQMTEADLEFFCEYAELDLLAAAAEALGEEGTQPNGLTTVQALLSKVKEDNPEPAAAMEKIKAAEAARAEAANRKAEETKKLRQRPWSQDELEALARCAVKFPAGTQKRWQLISAGVAVALGTKVTRNKDECCAKYTAETPLFTQIAANIAAAEAAELAKQQAEQQKLAASAAKAKAEAEAKLKAEAEAAAQAEADKQAAAAAKQAAADKAQSESANASKSTDTHNNNSTNSTPTPTAAAATTPAQNGKHSSSSSSKNSKSSANKSSNSKDKDTTATHTLPPPPAMNGSSTNANVNANLNADGKTAAVAAATAPPAEDVWSEEQHRAFVKAIQDFPSSMDKNERWIKIGDAVPGKTKKQCLERFKVVRAKLLAKKQAASSSQDSTPAPPVK